MSQKNQLPKRSEIAKSDQWRIQDLYASESEWEREYKETQRGLDDYQKFQGRLTKSAKILFEALQGTGQDSDIPGAVICLCEPEIP